MTSTGDNENETPNPELPNNVDVTDERKTGEPATDENEKVEKDELDDEVKGQTFDLWQRSKRSLFDYYYISEGEEEEEEEVRKVDEKLIPELSFHYQTIKYEAGVTAFGIVDDRFEIIDKIREMFDECKVQLSINKFLHKKYMDAMKNSASFGTALDKFDEITIFEDPRYYTTLENYEQTRDLIESKRESLSAALEFLQDSYVEAESDFEEIFQNLLNRELNVAKKIKPLNYTKEGWAEFVDHLLDNQKRRVMDVSRIRLAYVRLNNVLEKYMSKSRQFDNLGAGCSVMDYEYLLKRKEVYSERLDEQFELIKRLNEKNLACAGIIRHIDEESDLYNEIVKEKTDSLNTLISQNKIERAKGVDLVKTRAVIFKTIMKLKDEIGLLDKPYLLRKMASDLKEIARLKRRSQILRQKLNFDRRRASINLLQ